MKPITIIAVIAAALVGLLLAIFLYVPTYLETRLLPRWSAEAGIDLQTVHIRRIGWNGADLGPLRLVMGPDLVVAVGAVQIDYSPGGLMRREVAAVVLNSVRIEMALGDGGALPAGLPRRPAEQKHAEPGSDDQRPVGLGRLGIQGGLLALSWAERHFTIPFEVDLDTSGLSAGAIFGTVRFAPGGKDPIGATINMNGWDTLRWSLTPFQVSGPGQVHVADLGGELTFGDQGWQATASALTTLPTQVLEKNAATPLTLARPLAMQWHLSARSADNGTIQFALGAAGAGAPTDNRLVFRRGDMTAAGQAPRITAAGAYDGKVLSARLQGSAADLQVQLPMGTAHCPEMTITGDMEGPERIRIDATADLPATRVNLDTATAQLPHTRASVRIQQGEDRKLLLSGELNLDDAHITDSARGVRALGLQVRLPLQWPVQAKGPPGVIKAGSIWWQAENLGGLDGRLGLLPRGLWAEAAHRSKLFPGLDVLINTQVDGAQVAMKVAVPAFTPSADIKLGRFAKAAAGFTINGRFEAEADLFAGDTAQRATARIRVDQGVVRHPDSGLALAGIACEVHLKELLPVSSAPEQQLRVANLTWGKLDAEDLRIDFQIEPGMTLFIERAGLSWARGALQTQAFRLKPGLDDVEVTVYGDRLNLAMVLEQLGAARGTGEGTLNGRIPVRWRSGHLSFDNGFLYSTPGQPGTIQLEGTDVLLNGLPPGSPQRTQLDIATEALKDYTYNWARLTLDTRNEALLMGLQLDGKPNRLLPFAYDPQSGALQRYKGEGQAEFKGIRIDLNFSTPLNALLDYKALLTPESR
jgi:hypothetical protein